MNSLEAATIVDNKIDHVFNREVVKMPMFGPEGLPTPHYGLCFEDASSKDDWMATTVKKHYIPHTVQDVKDLCRVVIEGFDLPADSVEVKARFRQGKGHAVAITPTAKHRRAVYGTDTVWPSLYVRAYYGGAFKATIATKRDACSNLMMMRNVDRTTVSLRHQGNYRDNFDTTLEQFRELLVKFDDVVAAARVLTQTWVEPDEYYEQLYDKKMSARQERKLGDKIHAMKQTIERERHALQMDHQIHKRANLWELVNSVTGWVQHEKGRHGDPSTEVRAMQALDDPECNNAWSLAFQMAS